MVRFGYLTISTDAKTLNVVFKTAPRGGPVTQLDSVTVDLATGKITASGGGGKGGPGPKHPKTPKPKPGHPKTPKSPKKKR